jgi:hypothetical protein
MSPNGYSCGPDGYGYENTNDNQNLLSLPKKVPITSKREEISLDEALKRVGGFGRFQAFSVSVMSIVRNIGSLPVYIFGINSDIPELVCRNYPSETFQVCSTEYVCSNRSIPNFEFSPNWSKPGLVNNWVMRNDWTCLSQNTIMSTVSPYFAGFALGILLFFMPDTVGRRKSMLIIGIPIILS